MIEQQRSVERGTARQSNAERRGVIALALAVIGLVAIYFFINSGRTADGKRDLLPYQELARDLPTQDQQMFTAIRTALLLAEKDFVTTATWPEPATLAARGVPPFGPGQAGQTHEWSLMRQGYIVNYFGQPRDSGAPAWLLEIQEPEPGMLPDTAPPDEEHHRLSNGTMIHSYVWMHRFGGQVGLGFVRQPQNEGWTQVFTAPPNALYYNRR